MRQVAVHRNLAGVGLTLDVVIDKVAFLVQADLGRFVDDCAAVVTSGYEVGVVRYTLVDTSRDTFYKVHTTSVFIHGKTIDMQ